MSDLLMSAKAKLPAKEGKLFKHLMGHYENKQYRQCMKAADQIIKTQPNHGETLAMKGLALSNVATNLDKEMKQEAIDLVKLGVSKDVGSYISWHVFGLLYHGEKMFADAIKCYRVALSIKKDENRIWHDLAFLQVQTRDTSGYVDTRNAMLKEKSTLGYNWLGLAVAYHLDGSYEMAVSIIDTYMKTASRDAAAEDVSELMLYRNTIIEDICKETGDNTRALEDLENIADKTLDRLYWREKRADYLISLGRFKEAELHFRELLGINVECYQYHVGLMKMLGFEWESNKEAREEDLPALRKAYAELQEKYPRSKACKRLPLNFTPAGDEFRSLFSEYLQPFIRKGVPSIFSNVVALYDDPKKGAIIDEVVTGFYTLLKSKNKFTDDQEEEHPSTFVWMCLYLAQHQDKLGRSNDALATVDEAVAHTPTIIDLYVTRARILQNAGRVSEAATVMNEARELDLADRYLNTKCARYLLRDNRVAQAEATVKLFTKDTDAFNSVHDMQCIWLELEEAESFVRQNDYGMALKMYLWVEKHFEDIIEDQMDFHSYCLRKSTLRAYVNMMRVSDELRGHKYFHRCAEGIINVYLAIADASPAENTGEEEDPALQGMSPGERKKYLSKKRKEAKKRAAEAAVAEEAKKREEAEAAKEKEKENKQQKRGRGRKEDADPKGQKLLASTTKPLNEAAKFVAYMVEFFPESLVTHVLAFEVYVRRKRYALCLRAAKKAAALAPSDPRTHKILVRFFHAFDADKANVNATVAALVEEERAGLLGGKTVKQINDAFAKQHRTSIPHRAAAAEISLLLGGDRTAAIAAAADLTGEGSTLQGCVNVRNWLRDVVKDSAAVAAYNTACLCVFPGADAFCTDKQQAANYITFDESKMVLG